MATFEGLKETLSRVADYAREKTDLAVNTGKMAIELNRAKADANAARIALADLVMDKYVGGGIVDADIAELCAEIEDADEQIAEMTLALDAIREETMDGLRSVGDSVTNTVNSLFKKEADGLACPACGAALKAEYQFCPVCGCSVETVDDIVDEACETACCDGVCEGCCGCEAPAEEADEAPCECEESCACEEPCACDAPCEGDACGEESCSNESCGE